MSRTISTTGMSRFPARLALTRRKGELEEKIMAASGATCDGSDVAPKPPRIASKAKEVR